MCKRTVEGAMTVAHHQRTEEAANRLWIAASTQRPCSPVRDLIGSDDIALAYAVRNSMFGDGSRPGRGRRDARSE